MMDDLPEPDPADAPDPRAERSMTCFDALPEPFRLFLENYPRTADGGSLARLLALCGGRVDAAIAMVRELLPVQQD
jgi:hypothetical protein